MKNKFKLLLCALVLALGVSACGELHDNDELAGRKVSEYKTEVTTYMNSFGAILGGDGSQLHDELYNEIYAGITQQMAQYGYSLDDYAASTGQSVEALIESEVQKQMTTVSPKAYLAYKLGLDLEEEDPQFNELYDQFSECVSEAGDFKGAKKATVEKSGKTITATIVGDFSKRDLKMTFVYSTIDSSKPTAMNVEPVYTLGETMKKAGLNTAMGILIVFFMLVVMSGVIKSFEIIPKIEKSLKAKKEADTKVETVPVTPSASSTNGTDDLQLVAVIAAAIAASTGASTDSFVVRSIKKRY